MGDYYADIRPHVSPKYLFKLSYTVQCALLGKFCCPVNDDWNETDCRGRLLDVIYEFSDGDRGW